jgi:hypothetical protein
MESMTENRVQEVRYNAFGVTFMGPVLSFLSRALEQNTSKDAPLYFLAREGYWLEKAYRQHLQGVGEQRESHYLLVSRAFLFKIMIGDERSYAYSLKSDFQSSFYHLMRTRFLLSDREIKSIFSPAVYEKKVTLPLDKKRVINTLKNSLEGIEATINPIKEAYLAYLTSLGVTQQATLNLVDLGYSGTIQSLLGLLLNTDTHGHYLIASNPGEHAIGTNTATMVGYLKEGVKMGEGYLPLDRSMFLESLLTSPSGQFRSIRANVLSPDKFDFYYGRKVTAQRHFYELEQIIHGATQLCFHNGQHDIRFSAEEIERLLNSFLSKPNLVPRIAQHLFDIDDDVTGNGTVNALQFFGLAS